MPTAESAVRALQQGLWDAWNRRDAAAFAAPMLDEAVVVGFDGSQMLGRAEVERALGGIFARHSPPSYVGIIRSVRFPSSGTAILLASVGMAHEGALIEDVTAIATLVAVERDGAWRIAGYQNTPAQLHGRPEALAALNDELRAALAAAGRSASAS